MSIYVCVCVWEEGAPLLGSFHGKRKDGFLREPSLLLLLCFLSLASPSVISSFNYFPLLSSSPLLLSFLTFSMFLSLHHHSSTPCQHCLSAGGGVPGWVGGVCALLFTGSPPPPPSPSVHPSLSHSRSALPPPTLLSSASNEVIPSSRVKCSKRSERRGE